MNRTAHKYRLYPTKAQTTMLETWFELLRRLYNYALVWRKTAYEHTGESPNCYDQINELPILKAEQPEFAMVYSQVLQDVVRRVDKTFKAFFRRVKQGEDPGYPRYKGQGQCDSFTYPQDGFKVEGQTLKLSKLGSFDIKLHRALPETVKTCTITCKNNKWYAVFSCMVEPELLPESTEQVGIDLGLTTFAVLSNGETIKNPRFYRKEEANLSRSQRLMESKPKGSPERKQKRKVVARIHERIRNKRHDFVHQESRKLVNKYGLIATENLNVKSMAQGKQYRLGKSIMDAAWSLFRHCTGYKAANAGRTYVEINPAGTSQECSRCGAIVLKGLSVRVHNCPGCKLSIGRDRNSAITILTRGLASVRLRPIEAAGL